MTLELRAASTWFLSFDKLSIDIDLRFMGSHLQVVCPLCLKKKRVSGDSTALRSRGFTQSQPVFNGCSKTKPPFRHPYRGNAATAIYRSRLDRTKRLGRVNALPVSVCESPWLLWTAQRTYPSGRISGIDGMAL